jgi:hypothetical protein
MRAAVLGAASERRPRGWPGWVWATAATAAAGGAIAAAFFLGAGTSPQLRPREIAAVPAAPVEMPIVTEPAAPEPGSPEPVRPPQPTGVVAVSVAAPPPGEVRPARQIQFTGSSGTKIIWTLDPDFDL